MEIKVSVRHKGQPSTRKWILCVLRFIDFYVSDGLPSSMYVYYQSMAVLAAARRGRRTLGPGVTDGCEPLCGYWEPNLDPLQEQPVFLTTELPSLAP